MSKKYDAKCRRFTIRFNTDIPEEKELADYLDTMQNKSSFIKFAIAVFRHHVEV